MHYRKQVLKQVVTECANGVLDVTDDSGSWVVTYTNPIFKGSPFVFGITFSKAFTLSEVIESNEVKLFLSRFN